MGTGHKNKVHIRVVKSHEVWHVDVRHAENRPESGGRSGETQLLPPPQMTWNFKECFKVGGAPRVTSHGGEVRL